jgi:ligand-binding sensor domain-containing protein/anti-sigma regulatory factor (Ser/Thr protein kinase)
MKITKFNLRRLTTAIFLAAASGLFAQSISPLWMEILERDEFNINCLYEDRQGFLWLGSLSGLYRYDGHSYTRFQYDPADPYSMGDNKVLAILEDDEGGMWIGTQNGLNRYDRLTGRFTRYGPEVPANNVSFAVLALDKDEGGNVWIASTDGVYQYKKTNGRNFKGIKVVSGDRTNRPAIVKSDGEGGIYFTNAMGLHRLEISSGAIETLADTIAFHGIPSIIQTDQKGRIWAASATGVYYGEKKGVWTSIQALKGKEVHFLVFKDERFLWAGSEKGLFIIDTHTGLSTEQPCRFNTTELPNSTTLTYCHVSPSGTNWFCLGLAYLFKYEPQKQHFHQLQVDLFKYIRSIPQLFEQYEYEPGWLMISKGETPYLMNLYTQETKPFPARPSYNQAGWKSGATCYYEEQDGRLWIGTAGGLFLFDKNKKRFLPLEPWMQNTPLLKENAIRKIHRDRKGLLWIAFWNEGVCTIDFERHLVTQRKITAPMGMNCRTILEDRTGQIWIGTRGGLARYVEASDTFKVYRHDPKNPESLSDNTVFSMCEDPKGYIWCGTYGGGLNRFDVRTEKFAHFTTRDGLTDNTVVSVLADRSGRLWMSTFGGIAVFDPAKEIFRSFTKQQGLLNVGYSSFTYGISRDSSLFFFGGEKGVDFFCPDSIQASRYDPPVWFADFKLFNRSVGIAPAVSDSDTFQLSEHISTLKTLTLRHDQNVLTFDYVGIDHASPKTIHYAYRLIGFDTVWQYVGTQRSVTFTNLDPGRYTLEVKVTNGDGVWGSKRATLDIRILPPWWQTWAFRLSAACLLGLLLYALFRYRVRQISERETLRRRLSEVQTEALRAQMNPHFIYNCLSSLKLHVERNDNEKASHYIDLFATLLRRVLLHSRLEQISLSEELETLRLYVALEKMRFKDNFNYHFDIAPEAPLDELDVPPLIVQPYVENAIRHGLWQKKGDTGILNIRVTAYDDACQVIVEDNGIGRAAAAELKKQQTNLHISQGLDLTRERVEHFNLRGSGQLHVNTFDLSDTEGRAAGTRVVLTFQTNPAI